MYVIVLRFADRSKAPQWMEAHRAWIARGFADGVFLMVGSLQPNAGGAILATGGSRVDIEARVQDDPFVLEGVVTAELLDIAPNRTDERLAFLAS